jgi:hypothetical protein
MILFTDQQKEKIKKLSLSTDSKFLYNTEKWEKLNPNYKVLIKDFENKEISRQDVIVAFKNYYQNNNNDNCMKAFLLCMIWGFANTGYGTYRTNNYINDENQQIIKSAIDFIDSNEQNGLKKSFKRLKKIKGLGISYMTKVLYFATRAKQEKKYALIFDIRVASALVKLTSPKEIYSIVNVEPSSKFEDYEKFNNLLHEIAQKHNVEADQLEMYLFNQLFDSEDVLIR